MENLVPVISNLEPLFAETLSEKASELQELIISYVIEYSEDNEPSKNIDADDEPPPKPYAMAQNFPGLAVLFGKETFAERLLPAYKQLAKHEHHEIRRMLALSYHEIVKVYENAQSCGEYGIDEILFSFLGDENVRVNGAVLNTVGSVLEILFGQEDSSDEEEEKQNPNLLEPKKVIPNGRRSRKNRTGSAGSAREEGVSLP